MVQYSRTATKSVDELELARIGYWTDAFGCGVLFGVTLLAWGAAVVFMAAGAALPAIGMGMFMMVLAGCTVTRGDQAYRGRLRIRELESGGS